MKTMTNLVIAAYKGKYRTQKEIDAKQLEIEVIEHRMSGLSRSGVPMTPEQEKSSLPMPKTVSHDHSDYRFLAGLERKDELEREIDFLAQSLKMAEKIELLPMIDQRMLYDLYHTSKSADKVAEEYGYSKPAMYRHIYGIIDCIS